MSQFSGLTQILVRLVQLPFQVLKSIKFTLPEWGITFDLLTCTVIFVIIGTIITVFLQLPHDKGGSD